MFKNGQTVLVRSKVDQQTFQMFSFFGTAQGRYEMASGVYWIIEINPYERTSVLRVLDYSFSSILIHESYLIKADILYPDLPTDNDDEDTVFQRANRQAAEDLNILYDVVREKTEKIERSRMVYLDDLRQEILRNEQ